MSIPPWHLASDAAEPDETDEEAAEIEPSRRMCLIERLAEVGKRNSDSVDIDGLVELIDSVPRATDERIGEIEDLVERMEALLPHDTDEDEEILETEDEP